MKKRLSNFFSKKYDISLFICPPSEISISLYWFAEHKNADKKIFRPFFVGYVKKYTFLVLDKCLIS